MLRLVRGDSANIELIVTDSEGNAVDLTDSEVKFSMKKKDTELTKNAEIVEPALGEVVIPIEPEDTEDFREGVYSYDVQVEYIDSGLTYTVILDTLVLEPEIT